ncbi:hypothetical protein CEXT_132921 [Caerostris extrusa]|uniref:Uncharacterized protein n=1 Tax=Caerostris extrusa TaxID=172846 RepID=A0AAV4NPW2_CAEEX|nr:hypothetical protein CEXT_132921 [Caerostris extrusa]
MTYDVKFKRITVLGTNRSWTARVSPSRDPKTLSTSPFRDFSVMTVVDAVRSILSLEESYSSVTCTFQPNGSFSTTAHQPAKIQPHFRNKIAVSFILQRKRFERNLPSIS